MFYSPTALGLHRHTLPASTTSHHLRASTHPSHEICKSLLHGLLSPRPNSILLKKVFLNSPIVSCYTSFTLCDPATALLQPPADLWAVPQIQRACPCAKLVPKVCQLPPLQHSQLCFPRYYFKYFSPTVLYLLSLFYFLHSLLLSNLFVYLFTW